MLVMQEIRTHNFNFDSFYKLPCSELKPRVFFFSVEDITVMRGTSSVVENFDDEIHTYVGNMGEEYTLLQCFKQTDGTYTAVFKSNMNQDVTVKIQGLDCSSKKLQELFYIFYLKSTEKTYMAFGIAKNGVKGGTEPTDWCRYDICLNCQDQEILVNIDSKPRDEMLRWSQVGPDVHVVLYFAQTLSLINNHLNVSILTLDSHQDYLYQFNTQITFQCST
jgi:hypothetical protein